MTEEIDIVAGFGRELLAVGEVKWTTAPMGADVLSDLLDYKLPSMRQAGFDVADDLPIRLVSRSGWSDRLADVAASRGNVELLGPDEIVDAVR